MKKFLTLLLLLVTLTVTAQSDRKINRLSKENSLYARIAMSDTTGGLYTEQQLFCGEMLITHFVNKRHFIAHSDKFTLDIDIKKTKLGENNSWVGVDQEGRWYYLTPFTDGAKTAPGFGVIIQPVSEKLQREYDLPVIIIANFKLCP